MLGESRVATPSKALLFTLVASLGGCAFAEPSFTDVPTVDRVTVDTARDAPNVDAGSSDVFTMDTQDVARVDVSTLDTPTDNGSTPDAGETGTPYRHGWTIDGTRDAVMAEQIPTTSASYQAYASWDDTNLYVGYEGPDLATAAADRATKWLLIYIDTDGGGPATGVSYNGLTPAFPTNFRPRFYFRWKADNSFSTLELYSAGSWTTATNPGVRTGYTAGGYGEWAIPLIALGNPRAVKITSLMLNERSSPPDGRFVYAGLYSDNFAEMNYATMSIPITRWFDGDFALSTTPSSLTRRRP